jgi:hypothetical protein
VKDQKRERRDQILYRSADPFDWNDMTRVFAHSSLLYFAFNSLPSPVSDENSIPSSREYSEVQSGFTQERAFMGEILLSKSDFHRSLSPKTSITTGTASQRRRRVHLTTAFPLLSCLSPPAEVKFDLRGEPRFNHASPSCVCAFPPATVSAQYVSVCLTNCKIAAAAIFMQSLSSLCISSV